MTDGSGYPKTSPSPEADGNLPVDREQNASTYLKQKLHWGLPRPLEVALFYTLAILAWMSQIAAAVLGSYRHTRSLPFAVTVSVFCVLHWAAWCQTAFAMMQRASWRREETIGERVQFLFFAVRLQRLMLVCAPMSRFMLSRLEMTTLTDFPRSRRPSLLSAHSYKLTLGESISATSLTGCYSCYFSSSTLCSA